jgi:hypothetical protein
MVTSNVLNRLLRIFGDAIIYGREANRGDIAPSSKRDGSDAPGCMCGPLVDCC